MQRSMTDAIEIARQEVERAAEQITAYMLPCASEYERLVAIAIDMRQSNSDEFAANDEYAERIATLIVESVIEPSC